MISGWRPPVLPTGSPWSLPTSVNLLESQDWRLRYGADLSNVSDRAELGTDAFQRPLRSRFQARLTASVRLLRFCLPSPQRAGHIIPPRGAGALTGAGHGFRLLYAE